MQDNNYIVNSNNHGSQFISTIVMARTCCRKCCSCFDVLLLLLNYRYVCASVCVNGLPLCTPCAVYVRVVCSLRMYACMYIPYV